MLKKRIARAVVSCLLISVLSSLLTSCFDFSLEGIGGGTPASLSGLFIDGKKVEPQAPERTSRSYLEMTEEEKELYVAAYTALAGGRETFVIKNTDYQNLLDIYAEVLVAILHDFPEFFWLNGYVRANAEYAEGSEIGNVTLSFGIFDYWKSEDLNEARRTFNTALISLTNRAEQIEGDYERVKFVHDYIIGAVTYDEESYRQGEAVDEKADAFSNSAYGALVDGKALCGGYAKLFQAVMHRLGYECDYLTGTADGGPHAWNLLNLDGDYYFVDITWDDPDNDICLYNYFCVNEEMISRTHTLDPEFSSIEASATKYNYHFYEDLYFEDYDFVKIEKAITDNADLPSVSLRFDTEDAMEEAIGELIDSNKFREILSSLDKTSYSYIVSRDQFVIVFMPE